MPVVMIFLLAGQPDLSGEASREVARQHCVPMSGEEILVCGRRRPDERYRMPERDRPFDPAGPMPSVMRERMTWIEDGDAGIQSCGAVGPAAWTGCMIKEWKRHRDQTQWGKNVPPRW